MIKKSQLEKNLSNPEMTARLLNKTIAATKFMREYLWREDTVCEGLPILKSLTRSLEESIDEIVPNEPLEENTNQLELEL